MAVPNTTTFSLQDVVDEVNPTTDDLVDCFADSTDAYFDSLYKGSKDNLYNFRNYGCIPPFVQEIDFVYYPNDVPGFITISTNVDAGSNITERGICYNTTGNPDINSPKTLQANTLGSITTVIGLAEGYYYFTGYAQNACGIHYKSHPSLFYIQSPCLSIGASYGGGKIAYLFHSGDTGYVAGECHGLIAATSDQSAGAEWGCYNSIISGADGSAIGTGNQNTIDIVAGCGTAGIAAKICSDLSSGGFNDWYLPSEAELEELRINKVAIGGFTDDIYWSSTESATFPQFWAMANNFGGTTGSVNKNLTCRVRAIRTF